MKSKQRIIFMHIYYFSILVKEWFAHNYSGLKIQLALFLA